MKTTHKMIYVFIAAVLVIAAAALFQTVFQKAQGLPAYARASQAVKEAYTFAAETPGQLDGVSCYCGCMQHPHEGRIHSRGLLDCYMNGGGFDRHASECDMCISDALEVKRMALEGKTKDEIRSMIDSKYR